MKFIYRTEWEYDFKERKYKRKKVGYNVYVMGKDEEENEIVRVCNFMKDETGCNWDGFAEFDEVYGAFFLELDERDMIIELKRAYKMAKK